MNFAALWCRCLLVMACVSVCACAGADAFGRFGYTDHPAVSGFQISSEGFRTSTDLADSFRFDHPTKQWKVVSATQTSQTTFLDDDPGMPSKLRYDLFAPGFSLFFSKGLRLHLRTTGSPYITWAAGSVSKDVPTPDLRWAIVSFQDAQPPIVLGFPDGPCTLKFTGRPANWVLESDQKYQGWVKIGLPLGLRPARANDAASLGALAVAMVGQEGIYGEPSPSLRSLDLKSDLQSVTATWNFDRKGAVVPVAATLANIGQYPLKVLSGVRRINAPTEAGPLDILTGTQLQIRFPVRRIPTGRGLALGAAISSPLATVSAHDVPSVVELALENLVAGRDLETRKSGEATLAQFLAEAVMAQEPVTKQSLLYAVDGQGIDLAAAHAFLMQALTSTRAATSEANSLLTSVAWRMDWSTWSLAGVGQDRARRAAAIASLSAALCPEPERRLTAGQLQAGLAAERGLAVWRRRYGYAKEFPNMLEPALGLRQGIFGLTDRPVEGRDLIATLCSPIRAYGDLAVSLASESGSYLLSWNALEAKQTVLTLASEYALDVRAKTNISTLRVGRALGFTELRMIPETAGSCVLSVVIPAWAKPPPAASPVPRYTEIRR